MTVKPKYVREIYLHWNETKYYWNFKKYNKRDKNKCKKEWLNKTYNCRPHLDDKAWKGKNLPLQLWYTTKDVDFFSILRICWWSLLK